MIKNKTTLFTLTRQNQKGQVAIFVALIFQVIFIFFALLINVGLLIHHKINLQHSTDLAAYYGAMKQAEQMNAIAHINFQMRQAWKLLTWRYRILGTFGIIRDSGANFILPFDNNSPGPSFVFNGTGGGSGAPSTSNPYNNGQSGGPLSRNCSGSGPDFDLPGGGKIGIQDLPFFCAGNSGFSKWPQDDNSCQFNCDTLKSGRLISALPNVPNVSTPWATGVAGQTNNLINEVNSNLANKCQNLGKANAALVAKFLIAYATEAILRGEAIKMLAANLSQDVDRMVDIDGKSIQEGSERTFKNNLTGANFTGLSGSSFEAYNGLNSSSCKFREGSADDNSTEFLKKIDFQFISYMIHNCTVGGGGTYLPVNMYSATGLSAPFQPPNLDTNISNFLLSFFDPRQRHTIGFEKNPACIEYYAVKTTSEPTIPFLPLSKIKLTAVAAAKPFGGSIGPWYGKTWPMGQSKSAYTDTDPLTKTDATLPRREFIPSNPGSPPPLSESVPYQLNFSFFVGDKLGLRNLDYIAANHSMLIMRDISPYDGKSYNTRTNNIPGGVIKHVASGTSPSPTWPDYDNWRQIDAQPPDFRQLDTLATSNNIEAGSRAIEISAIAPNQFDINYYSIDPDFYNNYYVKIFRAFDDIKQAAGNSVNLTANRLRADFGAKGMDGSESSTPMDEKSFSVKDQIFVKNQVLRGPPLRPPSYQVPGSGGANTYDKILNYLVGFQSSLLTGWTFLRFNDYDTFPSGPVNNTDQTMSFGQCNNAWNDSNSANKTNPDSFGSPMNENNDYPPVPGNCVTGGRTGYSVKMVSPKVIMNQSTMLNPIPQTFFTF